MFNFEFLILNKTRNQGSNEVRFLFNKGVFGSTDAEVHVAAG